MATMKVYLYSLDISVCIFIYISIAIYLSKQLWAVHNSKHILQLNFKNILKQLKQ